MYPCIYIADSNVTTLCKGVLPKHVYRHINICMYRQVNEYTCSRFIHDFTTERVTPETYVYRHMHTYMYKVCTYQIHSWLHYGTSQSYKTCVYKDIHHTHVQMYIYSQVIRSFTLKRDHPKIYVYRHTYINMHRSMYSKSNRGFTMGDSQFHSNTQPP